MASLYSPQSQAGIMSFYDAPTNGPKLNPKIVLAIIIAFPLIVLAIDHFLFV